MIESTTIKAYEGSNPEPIDVDPDDLINPTCAEYEHVDGSVCLTGGGNVLLFCHPDCTGGADHRAIIMTPATALELAQALTRAAQSPHLRPPTKTPAEEAAER